MVDLSLDIDILPRMETIYEDTKSIMGVELEFKWGQICKIIKHESVLDAGLGDISLYANIRKSTIRQVATRPDIFPCAEVIEWILPQEYAGIMIMSNIERKSFASFSPTHITKACKIPTP